MKYRITREQQLYCSLDVAWKFFSSANNLALITPGEMNFKVLDNSGAGDIFPGMEINYSLTPLFGIPMKWKTRITQVDHRKSFTDFQENGPYRHWSHYHEFLENEKGVLMKDTVEYELPLGVLGRIVHRLLVREKLENIFNYRREMLSNIFQPEKQTI